MKPKITKTILLTLLLTTWYHTWSQNIATQLIQAEELVGDIELNEGNAIILDVRKSIPSNLLQERITAAQVFLRLQIGADHIVIENADYDLEVAYKVWMLNEAEEEIGNSTIGEGSLQIDETRAGQLQVLEFLSSLDDHSDFSKIKIVIDGAPLVQINEGSPEGLAGYIATHQLLSVTSDVRYEVDVRAANTGTIVDGPILEPKNEATLNNRVQAFSWNTGEHDFPNYELQILKLYNSSASHELNLDEIEAEVNWEHALKIETQSSNTHFQLSLGEGSGFYLWRVRAIGNYYTGGIANSQNYGNWSSATATGEIITLNRNSLSLPEAFYYEDPDDQINWIYNRVFTEGNQKAAGTRTSEGISYADGLLNLRQNQVYNSANDNLLISQTLTDYSGRPSWSSLPVPISGDMNTGYRLNFVQNEDEELYTAMDFDEGQLNSPKRVKVSGTDFQYYSDENPNLNIPSAEGYAFKRTLFKNDGTGRVAEESGVGKVHALGTQTDGRGRTTRMLYGQASDDELIRIFGEEAPLEETVSKTITLDPNNVASITYTSITDGNVIATALATIETDNLSALKPLHTASFEVKEDIDQNCFQDRQFISYKRLALASLTTIKMTYELDCSTSGWGCLGGACEYGLRFTLTDLSQQHVYQSNLMPVSCGAVDLDGISWTGVTDGAPPLVNSGATITLPAGEYLLSKALMDELPLDIVNQTTGEAFEATQTLIDAIAGMMQAVDNEEEYALFSEAMVLLKEYFATNQNGEIIRILNLPEDFEVPEDFTFKFDPTTGTNDPAQLTFTPACCPASSISIAKPDLCLACEAIDLVRDNNTIPLETKLTRVQDSVKKYFIEQVLDAHLEEESLPYDFFDTIAPGFTRNSMAYMIAQMILSKYYKGNAIQDPGDPAIWYKAEHDQDGGLTPILPKQKIEVGNGYNYVCKELFNCWTQAVNMLGQFTGGEETNIMDAFNERQGEDASEDHYDDDEALDKQSLGDRILSFVISIKMRRFNNSDAGLIKPARIAAIISLPSLFMDCAGYQFAAIIDGAAIPAPDEYKYSLGLPDSFPPDNDNLTLYLNPLTVNNSTFFDDHGKYAPMLFDFEEGEYPTPRRLYYSYILRPEWMFKYFVYNVSAEDNYLKDVIGTEAYAHLLPDHLPIEINSCYNPPDCSFEGDTDHSLHEQCFRPCNYYHESWSADQRLNFYNQIRNAPVDIDIKRTLDSLFLELDEDDMFKRADPECAEQEVYIQDAYDQLQTIKNGLPSRAGVFKARIERMLLAHCYEIVDCNPTDGQVSTQQINLMVQGAINEMRNKLELIRENVGQEVDGVIYPFCEAVSCHWINSSNQCEEQTEIRVTYFALCDQLILNQIQYWDFVPYGVVSQCDSPIAGPNLSGNQYDGENCTTEKDYSETYKVNNSSVPEGN